MRPIRKGDRGPAVEDVQRRLLALGEDLGASGVDGVFLGATLAAVRDFQERRNLGEDGVVGPETWSALVDASFRMGDRLLYLRMPHLHGADVAQLQGALNALGFACGEPDGIFGVLTERAVREFQTNTGLPSDGIAGPDTFRAVSHLRHVWGDKEPGQPGGLTASPARSAEVLLRIRTAILGLDAAGVAIAERVVNLAEASDPRALLSTRATEAALVIEISQEIPAGEETPPTVSAGTGGDALTRRLAAALAGGQSDLGLIRVALDAAPVTEEDAQRIAVGLLDGLCLGLASAGPGMVP